jgi:hypothetical protein
MLFELCSMLVLLCLLVSAFAEGVCHAITLELYLIKIAPLIWFRTRKCNPSVQSGATANSL